MRADPLQKLQLYTDDVDELRDFTRAAGWQFLTQQTSPGQLGNDLKFTRCKATIAWRSEFLSATTREAHTPPGMVTFGMIIPASRGNRWCNHEYDDACLLQMPDADFTAANPAGMIGYQLAVPSDIVEEAYTGLQLSGKLTSDATLLELNAADRNRFAHTLEALVNSRNSRDFTQNADWLLENFLQLLSPASSSGRSRAHQRRQAFDRAREYMHAHLGDAVTLADICRNTGASRRSVTEAFREGLGISPMAYLKILRLNRVHSVLLTSREPGLRIADVANDNGFWHMGQFARDYRALFGVLPSQTLASVTGRFS